MGAIRNLVATLGTAEAIADYLASTATVSRSGPTTYNDLLKTGLITPDEIKAFDQQLVTMGYGWIAAGLAGAGVDIADPLVHKLFTLLPNGKGDKIAAIAISTAPQWQQLGLDHEPTLKEVQAEVDVVPDGRAVSISMRVLSDGSGSVSAMVQNLAGTDPLDIVESFSSASTEDARLTERQRRFFADLVALVSAFGNS